MTAFKYLINKQKSVHVGDRYDWVYPANEIKSSIFAVLDYRAGQNYSTSHKRVRGAYRSGGSWLMYKVEQTIIGSNTTVARYGYRKAYAGLLYTSVPAYVPNPFASEEAATKSCRDRGAEAYHALKPTKPDFSAATSLYELRELFPLLKKGLREFIEKHPRRNYKYREKSHRTYGDRHLATQFGWIPLARDIHNAVRSFQGRKKRFEQLLRDEGRPVRRRVNLQGVHDTPEILSVVTKNHSNWWGDVKPQEVTQCYPSGSGAKTVTTSTRSQKTWAVGRARYLLPPGPRGDAWNRALMRRIMGARITPQALYQVIPWSWLADYFTDLGHFIEAVSPGVEDRIVFDYAYVMQETVVETKKVATFKYYRTSSPSPGGGKPIPYTIGSGSATSISRRTCKTRVAASPFGWGFSNESLTPHQVGILGALGLSKI